MKRFHLMLGLAVLSSLSFVGCNTGEEQVDDAMGHLPEWVRRAGAWYAGDQAGEKEIYSVGAAADHKNRSWQLKRARADAKNEMAGNLGTHVQSMFTEYQRQAGDMFQEGTESFIENVENVSRQIAEASLVGLQQVEMYKDPSDGTLYVMYKLPLDTGFAERYKKEATAHMREQFAEYSQEKKDEALGKLDQALANSVKNIQEQTSPYATEK